MNRLATISFISLTIVIACSNHLVAEQDGTCRVYFGTYTNETSKGIYLSTLDSSTGKLSSPELAAEAKSPSFLAIHPNRQFLYAVSEISDAEGKSAGGVCAYSIDSATGRLTVLNQQPSMGASPCHLNVDATGKNLLVANYRSGTIAVLPIAENGHLQTPSTTIQHQGSSVNKQRQEGPHAHSINLDAKNRFAFVADLGLDKVMIYQFDAQNGTLTPNSPPAGIVAPGSGPRHFAFHPSGKYAFVNNEINSTLTAFSYDADRGSLTEIHTLPTLPEPNPASTTAETVVHPSGKFVYVSNRGHDSLAIFQIDESTGRLTAMGHHATGGKVPRNFNIDPTGQFVVAANQNSSNVVVLKIDQTTGSLSPTGNSIEVSRPVCVRFLKSSK